MNAIEEKAARYLAEGKVKAKQVDGSSAVFHVSGSTPGDPYHVKFSNFAGWKCDCPARVDECAHVKAAMLVTDLAQSDADPVGFAIEPSPDIDALLKGI